MTEKKPLTIVELKASNVKRLRAVRIRPDGSAVVLGGKNGQGKSSVLDAITYALAGKDAVCSQPVRRGAESAEIVCDLGEIVVKRTFKPDGDSSLTVTSREGARFPSPQALLDRLTGRLTFDPLAFSRMKPAEQSETLRSLVGLDFSDLDVERETVYAQRTTVNRDGQALRARFDGAPWHEDAPAAEQSTAAILEEQQAAIRASNEANDAARRTNDANATKRATVVEAARTVADHEKSVVDGQAAVDQAQAEVDRWTKIVSDRKSALENRRRGLEDAREEARVARAAADALVDVPVPGPADLSSFRTRLQAVEATNAKVRANASRKTLGEQLEAKRTESARLTARLEAIDREKADAIAAAKMPVAGLGFDAAGVTLNGLPFDQASAAEQLRVSVAMGFAMNPRLRVLLVRDASLLDAESLRMVTELAEANDAQVWLERVENDGATTVLIEDGQVATPAAAASA